jgi:hypothetical protein
VFILEGIKHGFNIVDPDAVPKSSEVDNYASTNTFHKAVEKQILSELDSGHYAIVNKKPTLVSALGAIPKPNTGNNKIRIITDCSRPDQLSVNDYATQMEKVKYQSLQDACDLLSSGCYMLKCDLREAYRSVGTRPSQYQFMGLKWTFTGDAQATYMIAVLYNLGQSYPGGFSAV